jgi:hypothetical protein
MKILCTVGLLVTLFAPVLATAQSDAYGFATGMEITATGSEECAPDDSLKPGELNFILVSNGCMKDSVNTWSGTFTRTIDSVITVSFRFTLDELGRIRDNMLSNGILEINQHEGDNPICDSLRKLRSTETFGMWVNVNAGQDGYYDHLLIRYEAQSTEIVLSGNEYGFSWVDASGKSQEITCNPKPWSRAFIQFVMAVHTMMRSHPEIRVLPEVMCM